MKHVKKRMPWLALALATTLAITGCSSGGDAVSGATGEGVSVGSWGGQQLAIGDPVVGGEMNWGILIPIEALDSGGLIGGSSEMAMLSIFDRLMKFDGEGNVVPGMAESLESDDNINWTLKLRSGINFTDGTPFDAQAVIDWVTRVGSETSMSFNATDARTITSMAAPDAQTVEFTLEAANNQFDALFATGSLSMVGSPTAAAELGERFALEPVGAGPFMVDSFTPNGNVVLVRNPDYYQNGLPYLDKLTLIPSVEEDARISAILSGDLDGASMPVNSRAQEAQDMGLTVLEQPWFSYTTIVPNLNGDVLSDVRIRSALNAAIDRNAINQVVYDGQHDIMSGVLTPSHPYYAETDWPGFDADAARALVEEYTAETGKSVTLDMLTNQSQEAGQIAALVQEMLADVGIDLTYSAATPTAQVTAAITGEFDLMMMDQGVPAETTMRLKTLFGSGQLLNFGQQGNPELDALLASAAQGTNEERIAAIGEMQSVIAEWVPVVPLVAGSLSRILGPNVAGFPDGVPFPTSQDLIDTKFIWMSAS